MPEHPGGGTLASATESTADWSSHNLPVPIGEPHRQPPSGQSYDRILPSGSNRVHAGNVYNKYYHVETSTARPEEQNDEQSRLLRTFLRCLNFKEASSRHASIATAHPDACRWVVDCQQYKRWRDADLMAEHHGCLWVKGKPGAGKSTIMKGLLRHAKVAYANDKVVSFFFNTRGTPLERSTEGIYRSLMHQMADNVSLSSTGLDVETMEAYAEQGWPLELLKDLCREAVRHLTMRSGVTLFVDALDEGYVEDDVRAMVTFVEELTAVHCSSKYNLHVCLASRHYPTISMHDVETLVLDDLVSHGEDIATYVRAQLRIGNTALRAELASSICVRASGVFLWVVLVVRILNKEADHGNQHNIPARLQEIPDGLLDLFDTTIERNTDSNQCLLPTLMWVLFSEGSLKPIELYFAIMISTGRLGPENVVWDPEVVDQPVIEAFLISCSRGLLESVDTGISKFRSIRVQLIHESVRGYLLSDGLAKLDGNLNVGAEAKCHRYIAKWCIAYMQLTVE
jgi:hypothetical protein